LHDNDLEISYEREHARRVLIELDGKRRKEIQLAFSVTGTDTGDHLLQVKEKLSVIREKGIEDYRRSNGATWKSLWHRSFMDFGDDYLNNLNVSDFTAAGSSLKFCLLAEGKAHIYPRFGRTMEWDTGAGQAVLEAAGGEVIVHPSSERLGYGKRARGFEMEVHGFGNHWPEEFCRAHEVTRHDTVESLFSSCDVISPHTKLSEATHHLINAERIARLPEGAIIVNTGRGELADTEAVLAALDSGALAGYATDVMEQEPPPPDHPLLSHPKAIVTAHIGSRTFESVPRQAMKAVTNLVNFLRGEGPVFCANGVVPSAEE